ncbi:MAG: PilZ domain-containing protein [Myxococcota bacterium]
MSELPQQRILLSHAPSEAYAPMTRVILGKLGYLILLPEEHESIDDGSPEMKPVVRILDERQLAEVPDEHDSVPILMITGRHGVTGADPRIAGAVRRPAGMHELFRLIQQLTEDTPRSTPRIATHLTATCRHGSREWTTTMLSLSENGCLVRSPEPMTLGGRIEIEFDLPEVGKLDLEAETAYQLLPDVGMIFHATRGADRQAIASYLTKALLA